MNGKTQVSDSSGFTFLYEDVNHVLLTEVRPCFFVHIVKEIEVKVINAAFSQLFFKLGSDFFRAVAEPCRQFVSQAEAFTRVSFYQSFTAENFRFACMIFICCVEICNAICNGVVNHFLAGFVVDFSFYIHRKSHGTKAETGSF